ncbi:MAG: hypothetical protein M3Y76_01265 [Chloroflexota bacterium]|nr:hypothetical protein [Chloroflexota bacterium]
MQYAQQFTYIDNEKIYDDIDILFGQLQTIEPPLTLIARVLSQVQSPARVRNIPSQPLTWQKLEGGFEQLISRDNYY